jgi:4-hydroxy-3-polyprenylbenzoate decarboxylase
MAYDDLRGWLSKVDSMGELKRIEVADWDLEMACFADPKVSGDLTSVFLFDKIKGYPSGYRVVYPRLTTLRQTALTFDLPEGSQMELVEVLRQRWPQWEASLNEFPPKVVESGPVMENVLSGDDVNLFRFPVPKMHELDGGRYIGTADAVITRDPDTGEVNLGTYRVMAHDEKTAGLYISPAHHGRIHYENYHSRGQACPVAVSVGHHPLFWAISCTSVVGCEYNWMGAIRGEPIEVVTEEMTGLPIPADSEIVVAGWCPPDKTREEGPFGEWTGYYGSGQRPAPIIEVERIYHRNNPIITARGPLRPQPGASIITKNVVDSALMHNELTNWGIPDVRGVWISEAGVTTFIVVSIKQRYAGHAKRVGLLVSQSNTVQQGRYVIVVDEDIDPSNIQDVLWALCFRSDPKEDIEIIRRSRTEPLDPIHVPGTALVSSMAIIDACKPYERMDDFPKAIEVSPEFISKFREKWKGVIP